MNANHLFDKSAANTLLFRVQPIDGRFPALEDGLSWPVILRLYGLKSFEADYAILTRKTGSIEKPEFALLKRGKALLGEAIPVDATSENIFAEIDVRPSVLGRLANVLFASPQLRIAVTMASGVTKEYRFVPGMAKTKFLLSPVVDTTSDFVRFAESEKGFLAGSRVESVRILTEDSGRKFFSSRIEYSFYSTSIGSNIPLPIFDTPLETRRTNLNSLVPLPCDGSLDILNGVTPVPMESKAIGSLAISGWAAISAQKGILADEIFIDVTSQDGSTVMYPTKHTDRADVAAFFKQPSLTRSGYTALIDLSTINGVINLGVVTRYKGDLVLCRPLRKVTLVH
jgi:hypothetical protein